MSFHNVVWAQELEKLSVEQLYSADYLVFGRVTYEGMEASLSDFEIYEMKSAIYRTAKNKRLSVAF